MSAAVFLASRYIERSRSVNHSTAAGELQLNLAEFHANQPHAGREQDQPLPPTRRTLLPVSSAISWKKNVGSTVASTTQSESHRTGGVGSVQTASRNFIESTVVDRQSHPWTSLGGSIPQFYAPVTVHPVTVNIDHSGIIREISRVNERLDSLTAEKSRFEKDVMARIEDGNSESRKTATSATAVEVHSSALRHDIVSQDRVDSNVEPASTAPGGMTKVHGKVAVTDVPLPVEQSRSNLPRGTVERLKIAEPPVGLPHESVPEPRLEPVPEPVSVSEPVVESPVESHSVATVNPTPEIEFKTEPRTHLPDVAPFELSPAESETTEPQTVPQFEFSGGVFSVPSAVPAVSEIASVIEFEAEPVAVAEPVLEFESIAETEPVSQFGPVAVAEPFTPFEPVPELEIATATEDATTDVTAVTPQTAALPVLPDLTAPGVQWAKRTTNPPFMNEVTARRSAPPAANTNRAPSRIQQVSHTVESGKPSEAPSNPTCQDCGNAQEKFADKMKAVVPPSPIQRLRSLFK